jgi:hypothetical protein
MPDITVANTDWAILAAIRDALSAARVDGSALFAAVTVTTSPQQAQECQFRTGPLAIVRYLTTTQQAVADDHLACQVSLELTLAAKTPAGLDESPRLQAILRLANAARNAICGAKPAASCAWGDGRSAIRRIDLGPAKVDTSESPPWAVALLPLTVCYTLDTDTDW